MRCQHTDHTSEEMEYLHLRSLAPSMKSSGACTLSMWEMGDTSRSLPSCSGVGCDVMPACRADSHSLDEQSMLCRILCRNSC